MKLFKHGSAWVRADFHLHTKADKEFTFSDSGKISFKKTYTEQLKKQNISVGVITNHNKFDLSEFKSLRQCAEKEDIFLLAGVEFSLKDIGVHVLIVFEKNWYQNAENQNYIEQFLNNAHTVKPNYSTPPYPNSNYTLEEMVRELDKFQKDYFIIMAHVDDKNGMCEELDRRNLNEFLKTTSFQKRVLAFERCSRDSQKDLEDRMDGMIACVVGSDHAQGGIDVIGTKPSKSYLKLGNFSFQAVKFALMHHQERVCSELPKRQNIYLRKVVIGRNKDNFIKIPLNPDLNTIIGIRGGGKSTLLETIRFGLGQNADENKDYKNETVRRYLGEGEQIVLEFADADNNSKYFTSRTWGQAVQVFDENKKPRPDLQPENFVEIAYFGQKDLEKVGKKFDEGVIEGKLLKKQLQSYNEDIKVAKNAVKEVINQLSRAKTNVGKKEGVKNKIAELEEHIRQFEKFGIKELIAKESNYRNDEAQLNMMKSDLEEFMKQTAETIGDNDISGHLSYQSKQPENQLFFKEHVFPALQEINTTFEDFYKKISQNGTSPLIQKFLAVQATFIQKHQALKSEFAKAKQGINDPNINVEKHLRNESNLKTQQQLLRHIELEETKLSQIKTELKKALSNLQIKQKSKYDFIQLEVQKLNDLKLSFEIKMEYQLDKERFKKWIFDNSKWLQIDNHARKIANDYNDIIAIYEDLYLSDSRLHQILRGGSLLSKFQESFKDNLYKWLTYKVSDKYTFLYNGKNLDKYSIGQKATALIIFVLANQDKDLFIIDQPEDDLDNYTVAKEIIERIKELKPTSQFIFVTHNPNILVLGDSEQIISCEYNDEEEKISFPQIGSIDAPDIQQTAIKIMEGGKEAFERRKSIYKVWKI